jgi:hypothetical protein
MTALQNKAMLATLSISRWTARKFDRKTSTEVDQLHNAKDGGRFNKILVDKAHTRDLMASAASMREYHYKMTLPWDDEGPRLLPARSYMSYTNTMRGLRAKDEQLRRSFLVHYPQLVQEARKRLGSLYDPQDYPDVNDIATKFDIRINMTPVPSANDFRVDVSEEAAAEIRASIEAESAAKFSNAMKDCYRRLHETVSHIHDTLSKDDPRIYDTLVSNAQQLVNCLPALNLTDDPVLETLRGMLHDALPVSADVLRVSKARRKDVLDDTAAILEKMRGYV